MAKYLTELIIEGKSSVLDNLYEPYILLVDHKLDRLIQAINLVAVKKGYKVVNQCRDSMNKEVLVLMEKKKQQQ